MVRLVWTSNEYEQFNKHFVNHIQNFRDAWKEVEGLSADDAKQQYIEALLEMFDQIGEQVSISEWLSGDKNGALIKEKLALLGKVV